MPLLTCRVIISFSIFGGYKTEVHRPTLPGGSSGDFYFSRDTLALGEVCGGGARAWLTPLSCLSFQQKQTAKKQRPLYQRCANPRPSSPR